MRIRALVMSILVLAGAVAHAEDAPPAWSGEFGLSYVRTTGNSSNSTVGGALKLLRQDPVWKLGFASGFVRSESESVKTAERLDAALRGERAFGERFAAYGQGSYLRNTFAGIKGNETVEAGGLYKLAKGPKHVLEMTGALSYTAEQRLPPDVDRDFAGLRGALLYKWQITPTADLSDTIDYLQSLKNGDDGRLANKAAVTASIASIFALKLEHQLLYLRSPVLGKKGTDTTMLASLVARWPAPAPPPPPPPCPCPVK